MIQLTNPLCELQPWVAHRQAVACAFGKTTAVVHGAAKRTKNLDGDRELPATRKQSL